MILYGNIFGNSIIYDLLLLGILLRNYRIKNDP